MRSDEEKISSSETLDAACKVYNAMLMACRTLSLYPSGHALSLNAGLQLHAKIEEYLQTYGSLRFEFELSRVIVSNEVLPLPPQTEGSPAFSLFRDGIRWIEFCEGLTLAELRDILVILNRYSSLSNEPEGDIAIAFWEAQFSHLHYEVVDFSSTTLDELADRADGSGTTGPIARTATNATDSSASHGESALGSESPLPGKPRPDLFRTPGVKSHKYISHSTASESPDGQSDSPCGNSESDLIKTLWIKTQSGNCPETDLESQESEEGTQQDAVEAILPIPGEKKSRKRGKRSTDVELSADEAPPLPKKRGAASSKAVEKCARKDGQLATEPRQTLAPPLPAEAIDFTESDLELLRERAVLEEQPDLSAYQDVLLDSLRKHHDEECAALLLEVLTEEIISAMSRWELTTVLKIFKGLEEIRTLSETDRPWLEAGLESLFRAVSSPEALTPLQDLWNNVTPKQLDLFRQVIERLHPIAAPSVASLLQFAYKPELQQLLEDVLLSFDMRDPQSLRDLLQIPNERVLERLIPLILRLSSSDAFSLLLQLARHESPQLRRAAVKAVIEIGPQRHADIVDLFIREQDPAIRQLLLEHLGRVRNELVEEHLLYYLQSRSFRNAPEKIVLSCYVTLGRCGSQQSIPLLRKTLIGWAWIPIGWRALHRSGAAIALSELGMPESDQILSEAERHRYPRLRQIVRDARQKRVARERKD